MPYAYKEAPEERDKSYKRKQEKRKAVDAKEVNNDKKTLAETAFLHLNGTIDSNSQSKSSTKSKSACNNTCNCHHHHYHTHIHYNSMNMSNRIISNFEFRICVSNFNDSIKELEKELNEAQIPKNEIELTDILHAIDEIESTVGKHAAAGSEDSPPLEDSLKQPLSKIKEKRDNLLKNLWDPNTKFHKAVKSINSIRKAVYNFAERYDKLAKLVPFGLPVMLDIVKPFFEIIFK